MVAARIWQRFALPDVLNRRFVSGFASVLGFFSTLLELPAEFIEQCKGSSQLRREGLTILTE